MSTVPKPRETPLFVGAQDERMETPFVGAALPGAANGAAPDGQWDILCASDGVFYYEQNAHCPLRTPNAS